MIIITTRNTVQKALIMQTVLSMHNHPTADDVYQKVTADCPNISRATVYRVLNNSADNGEVLRVSIANAPDRYDFTTNNHAHCICSNCGRVFDYFFSQMPELDSAINSEFSATGFYITVNGICKECENKTK